MATPLLSLLPLFLACVPTVAPQNWDAHTAAIQAAVVANPNGGTAPQLDDGTINIASPAGGAVDGLAWAVLSGGSATEAFALTDFKGFRDASENAYTLTSDASPNPSQEYNSRKTTTKCGPDTGACVAMDSFTYGAVPSLSLLPDTVPAGAEVIEYEVIDQVVQGCDGSPTSTRLVRGWLYRERGIVGGQERWNQHWFLKNSASGEPYAFPTLCDTASHQQIELVVKKATVKDDGGNPVGERSLRAAATALTSACSGQQTGCGLCNPGSYCDYALVQLDWWKKQ